MKALNIEIDKTYITNDGSTVKITMEDKYSNYCMGGLLIQKSGLKRSAFFSKSGIYNFEYPNHRFNIRKELK
jgi:hypothetical protein